MPLSTKVIFVCVQFGTALIEDIFRSEVLRPLSSLRRIFRLEWRVQGPSPVRDREDQGRRAARFWQLHGPCHVSHTLPLAIHNADVDLV